ncbi:m-AAA protease-interacting protein 1, mitochondrial [Ptiloglossa arizonensis]|uniref:m-AAA protease-interacting protein 1, mitochondrial n=1 Tax=Ptiloglossa arizonensis TaxID=3350558 RepID=UPI003FA10FE1
MLSLIFKKCTYHTQMRQFATVLMSNKDQVKKKVTHHWTELKYTNMINPNLTVYYRSFCTKDKETWPKKYKSETIWTLLASRFKIMKNDILIRTQIDNEFSLEEFSIGAQQAVMVVSRALAIQNYESLNGLVENESIEVLKSYISQMTEQKRLEIAVNDISLLNIWICDLDISKGTPNEGFDYILKIPILAYYIKEKILLESLKDLLFLEKQISQNKGKLTVMKWNYSFKREYVNNVGKPWIIYNIEHVK